MEIGTHGDASRRRLRRRRLLSWLGGSFLVVTAPLARADSLQSTALPRIEVGTHTGYVKKLAVSAGGDRVLTVSDDKTARLWDSRSGRLLKVLRVPFDGPEEGRLFAAAFLQNDKYAFVGGFTPARDHSGRETIYVFKLDSGELYSGIWLPTPSAILSMAVSADNSTLAVSQRGVLTVIDLIHTRSILAQLALPDAESLDLSFAPSNDLAVTTYDGELRVYRAAARYGQNSTVKLSARNPIGVVFSPDGRRLAVGFEGEPLIQILDGTTLKLDTELRAPAASQKGLTVLDWSADGRYVYAGGEPVDRKVSHVYRWTVGDAAAPSTVLTTSGRIGDIRRLPDGAFAYASSAPEVGVANADGTARWRVGSRTYDFGRAGASISVSADGHRVSISSGTAAASVSFDVDAPSERALSRGPVVRSNQELASVWDIRPTGEGDNVTALRVNGQSIALDADEHVRTWVMTPDHHTLVIGTAWSIRAVDAEGRLRPGWPMTAPDDTRAVAVSGDGELVVAAFGDGTVRWYRMADGQEILALLLQRNSSEWVAWTLNGFYDCSPNGDQLIGWQLNRRFDQAPRFYRAVQFERSLYAPDQVRAYFHHPAALATGSNGAPCRRIEECLPPEIGVKLDPLHDDRLNLRLAIDPPVADWNVFVNGLPAVSADIRARFPAPTSNDPIEIRLTRRDNDIRVEASNGKSLGLHQEFVSLAQDPVPHRGDLYIIAIGASRFEDPRIPPLSYASADAEDVAQTLGTVAQNTFRAVHKPLLLSDGSPLRAVKNTILTTVRDYLRQVGPDDTVIFFLSSHGLSSPLGEYFFVPADARRSDWDSVLANAPASDAASSLIRWQFFVDQLARTPGRRVLVVDTCASSDIKGDFNVYTLAKRSMASEFALLTASKGSEQSQELKRLGHGIFTNAWLEALRTGYDPDGDGVTTLKESFDFAFDTVQRTHAEVLGPQTPQFESPDVLRDLPLVVHAHAATANIDGTASKSGALRGYP